MSFKYDQSNTILSNINYIFKKNSINVIVGASGKGKSTFIKILLGFYRVYSGSIKIGDIELRNISLKDLRNIISYTPQDTDLFTGTIEYNLKIGNESATEDDLIKACKIAHIHEFIKNLPNGYQSWLGECGIKLSGGEKQRICIARALIKNAKILILDEPTSELDMNSEEIILRNLKNNIKNNIIIIITHRKKVLDYSDSILEL